MDNIKHNIMLVDDNKFNLIFVKKHLEIKGYNVTTCLSGLELFEVLKKDTPDLILLDITMPDMDGITVCKKLQENQMWRTIPVIFLTADEKVETVIKGFKSGAVDYVTKPFIIEELLMRIKTHIKLKDTQNELNETIKILSDRNKKISRQNETIKTINRELKKISYELKKSAYTDVLTGLYNRRYMLPRLKEELNQFEQTNTKFTLVLCDIDHFKNVNDTYGHNVGDDVLVELSVILKKESRNIDVVTRWGGEEFLSLLPNSSEEDALEYADRVINRLRKTEFKGGDKIFNISITIGVSTCKKGNSIDDLIKKADDAMYEGKKRGRDRVVIYEE